MSKNAVVIKEIASRLRSQAAKDPHEWIEKEVHKVLNAGDKQQLLAKSDAQLVQLVQSSQKGHGSLKFSSSSKLLPFVKSWRASQ